MSREIKFRAWDSRLNEMCYCGLERAGGYHECMDDPLMQYTGLKDKNGVEIYEGDVVKTEYFTGKVGEFKRIIGSVAYAQPSFVVQGVKQYEGMRKELHGYSEVIGNIHENPELIASIGEEDE